MHCTDLGDGVMGEYCELAKAPFYYPASICSAGIAVISRDGMYAWRRFGVRMASAIPIKHSRYCGGGLNQVSCEPCNGVRNLLISAQQVALTALRYRRYGGFLQRTPRW